MILRTSKLPLKQSWLSGDPDELNKDKKIFHMVGRFHSDEKLGTAAQLQNRKSSLLIMNISCFSDASFENPDWEKFKQLGDFVILTDPSLKKTY